MGSQRVGHDWATFTYLNLFEGCCCYCCWVASVVFYSVRPQRRQPTRLPHPWDSPIKNTGVGCNCLLQCMKVKNESEVAQSCLTLRDPMDYSLPGSSVHGIFQARVLEWVAIAFSILRDRGRKIKTKAVHFDFLKVNSTFKLYLHINIYSS